MKESNLQHTLLKPRNELKNFVRRILVTTGDDRTDELMPVVPTGFAYFTYTRYPVEFNYKDRKIQTSDQFYLVAQLEHEKPWFRIRGKFFHVGLELFPLVPFYAFGVPGIKLTDGGYTYETLSRIAGKDKFSGFGSEDSPEVIAEKLQELLLEKLKGYPPLSTLEECLDVIYTSRGNITVAELTNRLDTSERNLRRQFKKMVGIGIKKYLKTIQFNTVFETISSGNQDDIYKMALEYGFYDHAHFINHFTETIGASPQKFINNPDQFLLNYLGNKEKN